MAEKRSWRERIGAGEPLEMPDWDFIAALGEARDLAAEFNRTSYAEPERRTALLRNLLGKLGEGSIVFPMLTVDLGSNIEIGARSFVNCNCTLLDTYPIKIGDDVLVGPGVMLLAATHPVRASERRRHDPETGATVSTLTVGAPIVVEDSVWIGAGAIVMSGVTIGARSTVGAGSVVTKSVPPDVVAAGNPCRVIRNLDADT